MIGTVVRGGTIYDLPGEDGERVGQLDQGQVVRVDGKERDGRWVRIYCNGQSGFTKSYRIVANGQRLDQRYGYEGWAHKPHGLDQVKSRDVEKAVVERDYYTESDLTEDACVGCDDPTEAPTETEAVEENVDAVVILAKSGVIREAAILNAGVQGITDVPGDARPHGFFEPGGGTLQLLDRWMTSRERLVALKANAAGKTAPISQARYAFAQTLARCATAGGVAYCAMQVAMKALG